jgi:hypothetical protein
MKYSKNAESTGCQSVLDNEREYQEYKKILETAMNPNEFEIIWSKVTPGAKLNFVMNSLKYVFKEKGKETEIEASAIDSTLKEISEKQRVIEKLLEE